MTVAALIVPALALALLLPPAASPLRASTPAVSRVSLPQLSAEHRGWRARLRSGSAAVAAAAVVAMPRGPAQAAQLAADETPSVARDFGPSKGSRRRRLAQPAFLGLGRKRKGVEQPLDASDLRGNHIDMDALVSPKMAKRFTEREFIFSEGLTYKGEFLDEIEELDATKEDNKGVALLQTVTTTGGALGLVYLSAKGLTAIERYFKRQELREIEAERELTGQYISVDAGDVDTSIDPLTGKNLTISKAAKAKPGANATAVEEEAAPPSFFDKILGVLGLDNTPASDDDDFWVQGAAAQSIPKGDGGGSGGAAAGGPEAGDDGTGGDDDGVADDSSDVDALDDLLG